MLSKFYKIDRVGRAAIYSPSPGIYFLRLIMKTALLRRPLGLLTIPAMAIALVACGGGGGGGGGGGSTTPVPAPVPVPVPGPVPVPVPDPVPAPVPGVSIGFMSVSMAAEPACGFDAVNVTVTKLRVHASANAAAGDAGWTEIPLTPARRINISQLRNGAVQDLATVPLPPGTYGQVRLVLDPNNNHDLTNSVIVAGTTTEVPLLTQTVATDGIAIGGATVDVADAKTVNLVAAFDGCHSVVPFNKTTYLLRPVIAASPTEKNGIDGFVATSLLGSNVRVTAQQDGVIRRAVLPDPATGEFMLARLVPGNYDIVVTANGRAASIISGVPVATASSVTALNNAASPIAMQPSATGHIYTNLILTPASTTQPGFGYASQNIAAQTMTISYNVGDLADGAARFLNLPLSAPQLAPYTAGGPLVFTAQPAVQPSTNVYNVGATAPGYQTISLPLPATAD